MHWLTRVLEKTENLSTTIQTIFSTEDLGRMSITIIIKNYCLKPVCFSLRFGAGAWQDCGRGAFSPRTRQGQILLKLVSQHGGGGGTDRCHLGEI